MHKKRGAVILMAAFVAVLLGGAAFAGVGALNSDGPGEASAPRLSAVDTTAGTEAPDSGTPVANEPVTDEPVTTEAPAEDPTDTKEEPKDEPEPKDELEIVILSPDQETVVHEPVVVVNLLESQRDRETGPFVYVIGEVVSPGAVPMDSRELHFIEAISKAGGPLKKTALLQDVVLVRHVRNEQRMMWHIDARIEYWGSQVPIVLQRDDIVFVPNTAIDDVNIWVDQYIRLMIPFPYIFPRF